MTIFISTFKKEAASVGVATMNIHPLNTLYVVCQATDSALCWSATNNHIGGKDGRAFPRTIRRHSITGGGKELGNRLGKGYRRIRRKVFSIVYCNRIKYPYTSVWICYYGINDGYRSSHNDYLVNPVMMSCA